MIFDQICLNFTNLSEFNDYTLMIQKAVKNIIVKTRNLTYFELYNSKTNKTQKKTNKTFRTNPVILK